MDYSKIKGPRSYVAGTFVLMFLLIGVLNLISYDNYRSGIDYQRELFIARETLRHETAEAKTNLREQILQWKNLLIRGENSKKYHAHLSQYYNLERKTYGNLRKIQELVGNQTPHSADIQTVVQLHGELGRKFRGSVKVYNRYGKNAHQIADRFIGKGEEPLLQDLDKIGRSMDKAWEVQMAVSDEHVEQSLSLVILLSAIFSSVFLFFIYVVLDGRIKKQLKAEKMLLDERNFSNAVVDSAGALVVVLDSDGRITRFNRTCERITGYQSEEVMGKHVWDILLLDDEREGVREVFTHLRDMAVESEHTNYWETKDGEKRLISWSNSVIKGPDGEVQYVTGIGTDVTQERKTEEALKRSQETYARAEAIAHIGSWHWNIATSELHWTDEIYRIFGREPQSFGASYEAFLDTIHPDDRQAVIDAANRAVSDPDSTYQIEHRIVQPNGDIRTVQEHGKVYRGKEGSAHYMIGTVHDITDQKEIALALAESELWLKNIFNSLDEAVLVVSPDRNLLDVNKATERMFGYSREEIESNSTEVLHVDHEHFMEFGERIREAFDRGESAVFEYRAKRKNGEIFPSEHTVTQLKDDEGTIKGIVSVVRDISLRKQQEEKLTAYQSSLETLVQERTSELKHAQDELVRKERLATLGQLTATVSHELRNPLGAMKMSQYIVKSKISKEDGKLNSAMDRMDRNIDRCDHIIDELLDFTRITSITKKQEQLDPWLKALLDEQGIPENIKLKYLPSLGDVVVAFDGDRLRRAVINVYDNACQALSEQMKSDDTVENPTITVSTSRENGRVWLSISDNGPGISDDDFARIFEPLYSTKGFGVGLGLSVVQQIMEQHRGGIEVETKVGKGASVNLWLPSDLNEELDLEAS